MEMILTFFAGAAFVLVALWLISRRFDFPAQQPDDYRGGPEFDIRTVLNGPIACEGLIYGPTGRVTTRFVAKFEAEWTGNSGILREHFQYDSGTSQDREWQLSVDETGAITAQAADLVGTGSGQQTGSGVQLNYKIKLPDSSGGHVLDVVDWMYMLDNGVIMNRSQFRKFGIKVGELVATMRPLPEPAKEQEAA